MKGDARDNVGFVETGDTAFGGGANFGELGVLDLEKIGSGKSAECGEE